MKKSFLTLICILLVNWAWPINPSGPQFQNTYNPGEKSRSKILSGKLFEELGNLEKTPGSLLKSGRIMNTTVSFYFNDYPSSEEITILENLGVTLYKETWTPPLQNHPTGFMIGSVPVQKIPELVELQFIIKIGSAAHGYSALNNNASQSVRAQTAWMQGYSGKGVKIAVLDSGIDTTYAGSDLPASFEKKDYSYYPVTDNNVANTVTGHGTHVAATALGRGVLSTGQNQTNNGRGSFKGMAPGASLVFLKIGQDDDAFAEDPPLIAAIDAAVNIYKAKIISLSYGGWDDYHDGTGLLDQKADWAYSKGVAFICSAGNDADKNKHWMGTVASQSESDFIEVVVSDPKTDSTMLRFNMIWADGSKRNDLTIRYYNSTKQQLGDVKILPATESPKGTESRYSYYEKPLTIAGTYYLKVINNSAFSQVVHLYEDWANLKVGTDHVRFTKGETAYTIGSPATAENALAVGAYISKTNWTNPEDKSYWWGASSIINNITAFSSLGPTMDQRIKPDICAPGQVVLSLRDKNVYRTINTYWIDNDGITGGDANYYCMRGTSMACPVVSGSAALFFEKYPLATPAQLYQAVKSYSNQTGLSGLPNNTWGAGRLDIEASMAGARDVITIDGNITDSRYTSLAKYTSNRNGLGIKNNLGEIKYYSDGINLFFGITGEVSGNNNILFFMDFSGIQGRGTNTLGGGNSGDWVNCAFGYMGNVKMDFDVDYALAFNKGNSTVFEFFTDAIKYGTSNKAINVGKTNQMGASGSYEVGSVFGGNGLLTFAYDSSFAANSNKGVEFRVPISAFTGVDTSQTLKVFALLSPMDGKTSNECIPGDPGSQNPGDGADFSVVPGQDFFTQPVKISKKIVTGTDLPLLTGELNLTQNHPNPFKESTIIQYQTPSTEKISLKVYDFTGKEVAVLVNDRKTAGSYQVIWDAVKYPPGIYFYRLEAGNKSITKKMALMK